MEHDGQQFVFQFQSFALFARRHPVENGMMMMGNQHKRMGKCPFTHKYSLFVIRSLDFQFIYPAFYSSSIGAFCIFHKYIVRGHREHKQSDLESKEEMKMDGRKIVCPNPFYIQISISNILYFTAYFTHFLLHSDGCFHSSVMTFLRYFLCFIILYFHFLHLFEDFFNVYIYSYLPYHVDNNDNDEVNCGSNNNNRDDVDNLFHLDFVNLNVGPFYYTSL